MTETALKVDPVLEYELSDQPGAVWLARQLMATWLADRRVPASLCDDLLLVCSELCTAALRTSQGPVRLLARCTNDDIVLQVEAVADRTADGAIDASSPVAFLDVVESVVDDLRVEQRGTRTVTLCRTRLRAAPA